MLLLQEEMEHFMKGIKKLGNPPTKEDFGYDIESVKKLLAENQKITEQVHAASQQAENLERRASEIAAVVGCNRLDNTIDAMMTVIKDVSKVVTSRSQNLQAALSLQIISKETDEYLAWVQSMMCRLSSSELPENVTNMKEQLSVFEQDKTKIESAISTIAIHAVKTKTLRELNVGITDQARYLENKVGYTKDLLKTLHLTWQKELKCKAEKIKLLESHQPWETKPESTQIEYILLKKQQLKLLGDKKCQDNQTKALTSHGILFIGSKTDEPKCRPMLSVEGFNKLTSDAGFKSIKDIVISNVNVRYCYPQVFAFPFKCRNLYRLSLCRLKDQTTTNENIIEALVTTLPSLSHLKEFDIRDTYLGQEGGRVLDALSCGKLRALALHGNQLIGCGSKLGACLSRHKSLAYLDIVNSGLSGQEIQDVLLGLSLSCPELVGFTMDNNSLKDHGSALSTAVKSLSHLKFLSFENCQLKEKDVQSAVLAAPNPIELICLPENAAITDVKKFEMAVQSKPNLRLLHVHKGQVKEPALSKLRTLYEEKGGAVHSGTQDQEGYRPIQNYINKLVEDCLRLG